MRCVEIASKVVPDENTPKMADKNIQYESPKKSVDELSYYIETKPGMGKCSNDDCITQCLNLT